MNRARGQAEDRRESGTPALVGPTASGMASRRGLLRCLLGAVALGGAALSGCGFQLRRPPELPFKRICVMGWRLSSPLAEELRRQLLARPGVQLLEAPLGADVVLQILEDVRDEVVAVSSAYGQVRELTLRQRLRFSARTPAGQSLMGPTELSMQRDMSYNETDALAKEHEAAMLYRAMSDDLAAQVVRRLASLGSSPAASAPALAPAASAASR